MTKVNEKSNKVIAEKIDGFATCLDEFDQRLDKIDAFNALDDFKTRVDEVETKVTEGIIVL